MALIIVLSAFNGLSDLVKSLYNSFHADIEISHKDGAFFHPDSSLTMKLKHLDGVVHYCELLEENALFRYKDQQCLATLKGVSGDFKAMTRMDTLIKEGAFRLKEGTSDYTVLGKGIAYLLNISSSDQFTPIVIYAPRKGLQTFMNPEDAFIKRPVQLAGMFSINDDFDYKYALVSIGCAQELFDAKNTISAIDLGLRPTADATTIAETIQQFIGPGFVVKTKYQQNELLFKTLKSEKLWTFLILLFIMMVATFNVIGSLTMLILEKKKDIRILWDMGADLRLIRQIFLLEGLFITLIGIGSGLLLGTLICAGQQHFEWIKFNESFVVSAYPIKMAFIDYLIVFSSVLLIGFIAAWYPVRIFTRRYFISNQTETAE